MKRTLLRGVLVTVFALGSYVAFLRLPGMIDRLLNPSKPAVKKEFVAPPVRTATPPGLPPEIHGDAVTPLKAVAIPGLVELPK